MRRLPFLLAPDSHQETQLLHNDLVLITHGKDASLTFYRGDVATEHCLPIDHHQADAVFPSEPIHCPNLDTALTYVGLLAMSSGLNALLEQEEGKKLTFRFKAKKVPEDSGHKHILEPGFNHPDWRLRAVCTSFVNEGSLSTAKELGCGCIFEVKRTGLSTRNPFPNSPHVYTDCPSCRCAVDLGQLSRFNFNTELPQRE